MGIYHPICSQWGKSDLNQSEIPFHIPLCILFPPLLAFPFYDLESDFLVQVWRNGKVQPWFIGRLVSYGFAFHSFSYLWSAVVQKQMNLLLTYCQKSRNSLMLHHKASSSSSLFLLRQHFIFWHHHRKKGEYSIIRSFESEGDHIPIIFLTVYCYNNSTWLLLIVVTLLIVPNLEIKLHHRYACIGKHLVLIGFGTLHGFRNLLGVLEHIPPG